MPSENWRTKTTVDSSLQPPLTATETDARPELAEHCDPQWEVELTPDRDLGFSGARGGIEINPPKF